MSLVPGRDDRPSTEYWFFDLELDVVRVYRRADGRFARPFELSLEANDVLTTPLLPGLEIKLARVFQDSPSA